MRYLTFIFFIALSGIQAQDSLLQFSLEPIILKSTKIQENELSSSKAIIPLQFSVEEIYDEISIQSKLNTLPGIFIMNQNNSAQDLRIAIRGFGARSSFGIRGIRMIVDGVPYTTPDGQSQVDNIMSAGIKNLELYSGPSSALYGNASGGVIFINQFQDSIENQLVFNATLGSFAYQNYLLEINRKAGSVTNQTKLTYINNRGFREHAQSRNYVLLNKFQIEFGENHTLNYYVSGLLSPIGNDPGGLNLEEVSVDRSSARERNIDFQSGEQVNQLIQSIQYHKKAKNNLHFRGNIHHTYRTLEARLPFAKGGKIDLKRNFFGAQMSMDYKYLWANSMINVQSGVELGIQNDNRLRFNNLGGIDGALALSQIEKFEHFSPFLLINSNIRKLNIDFSLRYDLNQIRVADQFLFDGDNSGNRFISTFSPNLGLSYELRTSLFLFSNFSRSFETPTLNELSNNPDNTGGFNPNLDVQKFDNYEIGLKALILKNIKLNVSGFLINGEDELIPYELEAFQGRTFYRNSGTTRRLGLELYSKVFLNKYIDFSASYSYSNFKYEDFEVDEENFTGNYLPGLPVNQFQLSNQFNFNPFKVKFEFRHVGRLFAENSNSIKVNAFQLLNMNISYKRKIGNYTCIPYFGANNILNQQYFDNIRLNAFGGRFYEPAPGINFFGGLKLYL